MATTIKAGEILVLLDRDGTVWRQRPFDLARQVVRGDGSPIFGPYAYRLMPAAEVAELPEFKAYCQAAKKEATRRQAAKWRGANVLLCVQPLHAQPAVRLPRRVVA